MPSSKGLSSGRVQECITGLSARNLQSFRIEVTAVSDMETLDRKLTSGVTELQNLDVQFERGTEIFWKTLRPLRESNIRKNAPPHVFQSLAILVAI